MPFDAQRDLAPISLIARGPLVLVVNPAFSAKTVGELVAMAKAKPGSITYASAGNGTPVHLAAEMLKSSAGIDLVHVPYKGAGPAVTDVLGGQVPVLFAVPGTAHRAHQRGQVPRDRHHRRGALQVAAERSHVHGARHPGRGRHDHHRLRRAREDAARDRDATLRHACQSARDEEVTDKLNDFGLTVVAADPERTAKLLADETTLWAKVVKSAGVKLE